MDLISRRGGIRPFCQRDKQNIIDTARAYVEMSTTQSDQIQRDLARWKSAKDWSQMIELNKRFIQDSMKALNVNTPYRLGPLDFKHMRFIPILLRLHNRGLLVTGSRPSHSSGPYYHDDEMYCEALDLPCVDFLVRRDDERVVRFIETLLGDEQLITQVHDLRVDPPEFWPGSCTELFDISKYRNARSENELSEAAWKPSAHFPTRATAFEQTFLRDLPAAKDRNFFWCVVTTRQNIEPLERIEDHANAASLKRDRKS